MVMKDQENPKRLENGDVIRVYRKSFHYDHYGIYVAMDNSVIHYTTPKKEGDGNDSGICGELNKVSPYLLLLCLESGRLD